jgi:microcystin degradation protein MlrC
VRIVIGSLQHEANTFSPRLTDVADFQACYLYAGRQVLDQLGPRRFEIGGACDVAAAEGMTLIPTLACWAMPSGRIRRAAYESLKRTILSGIGAAGAIDGLLLVLHGAMVVEGIDDADGDLLDAARAAIGPSVPLVASLDLHANITARMVATADALVGYHTVPHVDHFDTGQRATRLLGRIVRKDAQPMTAFRKIPMITPAEKHDTSRDPMKYLMDQVLRVEEIPGVLAAALYPVQPWIDVAELGWAVVVVADGDRALAEREADRLAALAWESREAFLVEKVPIARAVARATETAGQPVVLSDTGDVSSGGAPGDSAALLAALIEAGMPCPALLDIVDPPAVERAIAAGVGASLTLSLGGTIDTVRQRAVTVEARVASLTDGRFVVDGPSLRGYQANLGRTAVLEVGNISIVVHERGEMNIDPALYRAMGLEPLHAKIVEVKSPCGFRAAYEPIAAGIMLLDSPGCTTTDFATLGFRNAPRPLFPLDGDAIGP